ncbi:MAG: hypothetical protein ABL308_00715 [Oceanicaulis sp.]
MTPAGKRYALTFSLAMIAYGVMVVGAPLLDDAMDLPDPARLVLALAPVVPALFGMREFLVYHRSMDEVQARIQSEAILIAAGVVAFASFGWGFVELWMDAPRIPILWVLPALAAVWGIATPFVARRYR